MIYLELFLAFLKSCSEVPSKHLYRKKRPRFTTLPLHLWKTFTALRAPKRDILHGFFPIIFLI